MLDDRGPYIQTKSGGRFHLMTPSEDEVLLEDVAWALAHLCRFTGHSERFYSVAEHSVLVSYLAPPELARDALMHDAAEAYVGDVSSPLKLAMRTVSSRRDWENNLPRVTCVGPESDLDRVVGRIEHVVAGRFGLRFPHPDEVKEADLVALRIETRDLMLRRPENWERLPEVPERFAAERAEGLGAPRAEMAFLQRAAALGVR